MRGIVDPVICENCKKYTKKEFYKITDYFCHKYSKYCIFHESVLCPNCTDS